MTAEKLPTDLEITILGEFVEAIAAPVTDLLAERMAMQAPAVHEG